MLKFIYGTMNSSKSLNLLATAHNYETLNRNIQLFKPAIDTRSLKIESRVGLSHECIRITTNFNFIKWFEDDFIKHPDNEMLSAILVDESQFLTKKQVVELGKISDLYDVDVFCYGLKNNYMGELFEGSKALLENADKIEENRTLCKYCNSKATHNILRLDGEVVDEYLDSDILIGDEEYESVCREHFYGITNIKG